MQVEILEIGQVKEEVLKYAVISASFQGKWVLVKHRQRTTWEIPGGRREENEAIFDTAKRELYEETGAEAFQIQPVCDYSVTLDGGISYGRLFYSVIQELGELPTLEIGEVRLFKGLPENLTYPEIQPLLHRQIRQWLFSLI